MPWTRSSYNWEWVRWRLCQSGGGSVKALPNSCGFIPRMLSTRSHSWIDVWPLLWGLPKWFNVMVAYLKASGNEKMYLDYLQVAQEAEKEEAMEPSCNPSMASTNKPWAMSFFPLWKIKGSKPAMTLLHGWHTWRKRALTRRNVLTVKTQMASKV